MNYYNEWDKNAAKWIQELIEQKLIPNGHVDSRSIEEVTSSDLKGYIQCHFFAGIAGWPLALKLADYPEQRSIWTASLPCQPFSKAGKQNAQNDKRHLWPVFAKLVEQCKPPTIIGEQVASSLGRTWLSGIFADLEALGYQRAGADLCAAGVGSPQLRQRLFWVADSRRECFQRLGEFNLVSETTETTPRETQQWQWGGDADSDCGPTGSRWQQCRDGKQRRIPSKSIFHPLFDGVSDGLGFSGYQSPEEIKYPICKVPESEKDKKVRLCLLKGAGNAIIPQVGATFIKAFL